MIRPGTPDDEPALAALARRAWARSWMERADPEAGPVDDPAAETLVFDLDGLVAGHARVRPDAVRPELVSLWVDPPAQGAGVGSALLAAAEARLAPGRARATLVPGDEPARDFLRRFGWSGEGDVLEKTLP